MIYKKDRRMFFQNLIINVIRLNPTRAIILPIALISFIASFTIDNSISFYQLRKHFQSKDGTHYYALSNQVVESKQELEVFEDEDGYYIKMTEVSEGKFVTILLTGVLLLFTTASIFAEELEIPKAVERTILQDVRLARKVDENWSTKFVYVAYTKMVLVSYSPKKKKEMTGLKMSVAEFMELDDYIGEKDEIRDRKLEELGI